MADDVVFKFSGDPKNLVAALRKIVVENAKAQESLRKQSSKTAKDFDKDSEKIRQAYKKLGIKDTKKEIEGVYQALYTLARSGRLSGKQLEEAMRGAQKRVRALKQEATGAKQQLTLMSLVRFGGQAVAVTAIVMATKRAGEAVISAGLEYQRFIRILEFTEGGLESAGQKFAEITQLSQELGLRLDVAAKGYAELAAATQGTVLAGRETDIAFRSLGVAMSAYGLQAGEARSVTLALQQMISKGKVSAEELRGQLGERLKGAFQIAARAMNVTTEELSKMLDNGELLSEEFIPKFSRQLIEELGPAAERGAGQAQAAFNRFETSLFQLKVAIADSGVLDFLADSAEGAAALISELRKLSGAGAVKVEVDGEVFSADSYEELQQRIEAIRQGKLSIVQAAKAWIWVALGPAGIPKLIKLYDELTNRQELAAKAAEKAREAAAKDDARAQLEAEKQLADSIAEIRDRARKQELDLVKKRAQILLQEEEAKAQKIEVIERRLLLLREQLATKTAEAERAAQQEVVNAAEASLTEKKQLLKDAVQAEKTALDKLKKLREQATEEGIRDSERLFNIRQKGLSEYEQQVNLEREAAKKLREARKALKEGDTGEAQRLSERVKELAESLNDSDRAARLFKKAAKVSSSAYDEQTKAAKRTADQASITADQQRQSVEEQVTTLEKLRATLKEIEGPDKIVRIKADITAAEDELGKLKSELSDISGQAQLALDSLSEKQRFDIETQPAAIKLQKIDEQITEIRRKASSQVEILKFDPEGLKQDVKDLEEQLKGLKEETRLAEVALEDALTGKGVKGGEESARARLEELRQAVQDTESALSDTKDRLSQATSGAKELNTALQEGELEIKTDVAQARLKDIQEQLKAIRKEANAEIQVTITRGTGTTIARATGGPIPGFASGGTPRRLPQGPIRGPGTGTSDSILARVSRGEYIINAAKAKQFGGLLDFINFGATGAVRSTVERLAGGFASGGLVDYAPPSLPATAPQSSGGSTDTLIVQFPSGKRSGPVGPASTARQLVADLLDEAARSN